MIDIRFASKLSRLWAACCLMLMPVSSYGGALEETTVFQQGANGYHTFRIPAIVRSNDGTTLLAFAEGRKNGSGDNGNIDMVLKRSLDGGATWSALQVIDSNGFNESGNPAPVVDSSTGKIILPFVQDREDPVLKTSTDNGATWSSLVDLGSTTKLPTWNGYFFGPVHGIQLERGANTGRIVVSGNHTLLNQPLHPDGREAHVIYSDDGGSTWQVGGILQNSSGDINPGESTIVELVSGSVYINTRNQGGLEKRRLKSYSIDSGETFPAVAQVESQLIDPVVQASVLRYTAVDQGDSVNRILFSNPASETSRVRMTIKSSFDETTTWNSGKLINRGPSGYSDMVRDSAGGGILYENGTSAYYERITFARFDDEWLDDPSLMQIDFRDNTANDQRGNGIDGSLVGGPTFVDGSLEYGDNTALRFDGSDDRVVISDTSNHLFDFDDTDSFTIETVFKTTSHGSGGTSGSGPLVAKDVGPSTPSYWMRIQDGKLRFLVDDGSSVADVMSPANVNDGEWHHAAAIFDRTANELRLLIDHHLVDTQPGATFGSLANSNDLLIGAFNSSSPGVRRFVGDIDLVRISMGALDAGQFVQPNVPGDVDADGDVDGSDFLNWQRGHGILNGAAVSDGDADGDGDVDNVDLGIWQVDFGSSAPSLASSFSVAVPEPTALMIASIGLFLTNCPSRKLCPRR